MIQSPIIRDLSHNHVLEGSIHQDESVVECRVVTRDLPRLFLFLLQQNQKRGEVKKKMSR